MAVQLHNLELSLSDSLNFSIDFSYLQSFLPLVLLYTMAEVHAEKALEVTLASPATAAESSSQQAVESTDAVMTDAKDSEKAQKALKQGAYWFLNRKTFLIYAATFS